MLCLSMRHFPVSRKLIFFLGYLMCPSMHCFSLFKTIKKHRLIYTLIIKVLGREPCLLKLCHISHNKYRLTESQWSFLFHMCVCVCFQDSDTVKAIFWRKHLKLLKENDAWQAFPLLNNPVYKCFQTVWGDLTRLKIWQPQSKPSWKVCYES